MPTLFNSLYGLRGGVFLSIKFEGKEINDFAERFQYVYAEEGNDECTITFNSLLSTAPDKKCYQENATLVVTWGYLGGKTTTRKVTVQEPKWSFDKNGRKLQLVCTEKGITTKQKKSKAVYKDKSLPEIAKEVGEKQGLKVIMEIPTNPKNPKEKAAILDLRKGLQQYELMQKSRSSYLPKFPKKNIPQANKTDAQMLRELGNREADGQWIAETRDDTIKIKKRDYNKAPYRAYIYAGGSGELFSFEPESKNRSKLGAAVNSMVSSWNAAKKQFSQTQANMLTENNKKYLTKYLKSIGLVPAKYTIQGKKANDKAIEQTATRVLAQDTYGKNNKVVKNASDVVGNTLMTKSSFGQRGAKGSASDNTSNRIYTKIPVTGEQLLAGVKKAQNTVTDSKHDVTGDGGQGNNNRDKSNLKNNPASALVWGDPGLECGQIITMRNVGKKYGGNYYLLKSTHTLEPEGGYTCSLELARQGHNTKAGDNEQSVKRANKAINTEIGLDKNTKRKVLLKTVKNGTKGQ